MNKVTIYRYDENKPMRTLNLNGEPWFVLRDVCEVLGLGNSRMVADRLFEVKEGKGRHNDWAGTQTLITPKGRETFRLLCKEPPVLPRFTAL